MPSNDSLTCPANNFKNLLYREKVDLETEDTTFGLKIGLALNIIDHILMLFILASIFFECYRMRFRKTALHATLCTFAFVGFLGEAIMVRYSGNILFFKTDRDWETSAHLILAFIGIFCGLSGSFHKYLGKSDPHFCTRHGKFGKWACIFIAIQGIIGICNYYGEDFNFFIPAFYIRMVHNTLGILAYITGMVAQYYGYNTGFFRRSFTKITLYKTITIIITILTLLGPYQFFIHKLIAMKNGK